MTAPTALARFALAYAEAGWAVFPCAVREKRPHGRLVPHGLKEAATDVDVVGRWWKAEPEANVGLVTGEGFDVLDVDGDAGFAELARRIGAAGRALEAGGIAVTGSGGAHYLFAPAGHGNRARMAPGLDWRGRGGYIVAPPSIHPSGERYKWALRPTAGAEMPQAPPWLLGLVDPPRAVRPSPTTPMPRTRDLSAYVYAAVKGELEQLQAAVEGHRNDALVRASFSLGQLVGGGHLQRDQAEYLLDAVARSIGLGEREIVQTMRSGIDAGIAAPRRLAS